MEMETVKKGQKLLSIKRTGAITFEHSTVFLEFVLF